MRDEDEANEAIAAGADIIMLDNIDGDKLASVAETLRSRWKGEGKKFLLETSGGITEDNLRERAISGSWTLCHSRPHAHFCASRDRYLEHELCASVRTAHRL